MMKIKAKVLTWENHESTVREIELSEKALAKLAEEIARERYESLHFQCITLEPDFTVKIS